MKNIALSLLAALTLSTPALANDELVGLTESELKQIAATQVTGSWKKVLFVKLDADTSGEITLSELTSAKCRTKPKLFIYADKDRSKGLNRKEFINGRDLLGRCK
jgi:hypothetical protein